MSTASNLSETARDAAKEAGEGVRQAGKAAADASSEIQKDLQALREDLARLAEQVGDILTSKGNAAWQRAKTSVDGVMADAQDKGRDAVGAVREVSDHFVEAIDESIKNRPYATLAIAAVLGFIFGTTWRR